MAVERIGKYRVLARLGQGGMARVLLTMADGPHGFHKLLVVKELREELAGDPDFLAMFVDEARIAARLNHPNIVQTYEIGNDGDRYFIAMEYLEGQPLNAIFRRVGRKNIPLEVHLRMLADVLAGLDHAHNLADFDGTPLGVVHRDVSPQNVFVTYDGQVKLVDFGIAKVAGASSRTQEGVLKGKISYISPEQARCDPVDSRADLFTMGLMLWECLAQRRLVQGEDQASVLARRINGEDPKIMDVAPETPPELAAICDHAMAPDPAHRFQSARSFHDAIEGYLASTTARTGPAVIGRLVSEPFAEERSRIRKAIEEQVKAVDHGGSTIQLELHPPSQTGDSLPRVRMPSDTPLPLGVQHGTPVVHSVSRPPKPRSIVPALGLGAVLAFGALAAIVYVGREPSGAPAPGSGVGSGNAPPGEEIALALRYPAGARATLDGAPLPRSPYLATVPRDGKAHQLVVEKEGFERVERSITFDRDRDLDVELVPLGGAGDAATPAASAERRPTPGPGWRGARPPPTAEPTATAKPREDDRGPRKPPAPGVEIDEQNPYKRKP